MIRARAFGVVAVLLVVCACADGSDDGEALDTTEGTEASGGGEVTTPDPGPVPPETSVPDGSVASETGHDAAGDTDFGEPCVENNDCASGWCVATEDGPVCTKLCLDECPEGWGCVGIKNTGADLTFVCVPSGGNLCQPCLSNHQCGDGLCIELTDGKACTRPCSADNPCPAGFECEETTPIADPTGASMQCVPQGGGCSCSFQNDGEERPCVIENEHGKCFGAETCLGAMGWGACGAQTPGPETCDGIDNDCNGVADDSPEKPTAGCANTNEHGSCDGIWYCTGSAGWTCNAKIPTEEFCDLADNDCDGEVDEDFKSATTGQYVHKDHCGACGNPCALPNAVSICGLEEGEPVCVVGSCNTGYYFAGAGCLPLSTTLCQPCVADADCLIPGDLCVDMEDGTKACGRDCSETSLQGTECPGGYSCQSVGETAMQCLPQGGSCDCLPQTAGVIKLCTQDNAAGTCFGQEVCGADGLWSTCDAKQPTAELCNGLDDDCDGLEDEGVVPPEEACQNIWEDPVSGEVSACAGTWTCSSSGEPAGWQCMAQIPGAETCDYQDNDCDGSVDEGFKLGADGPYAALAHCGLCGFSCEGLIPNATAKCEVAGPSATCVVDTCDAGFLEVTPTACIPIQDPSCQPCVNDAGCQAPGNICLELDGGKRCARDCGPDNPYGPEGECPESYSCSESAPGAKHCVPNTASCTCLLPEQTGSKRACQASNALGICTGSQTCDADLGWAPCSALEPSLDVCNGIDDDCDGDIDEDASEPTDPCEKTNDNGACGGLWSCKGPDGWTCSAPTPEPETCDFVDNDCDGTVDEPFFDPVDGVYLHSQHCGTCNHSCEGAVPFATITGCGLAGEQPTCIATACEDGYFLLGDIKPFCVPEAGGFECSPCAADEHCADLPDGKCTELDDATFCTAGCAGPADCDSGFECAEGRCLPVSSSCSCLPEHEGDTRACFTVSGAGSCFGLQTCDPTVGWSACSAPQPSAEICDAVDNDCDGLVDEGLVHDPPTCSQENEFGSCPGAFVCNGEAGWSCTAPAPVGELCDFLDNDCDGGVDEDFKLPGEATYTHPENCGTCGVTCDGAIPNATAFCAPNGGLPRCEVDACESGFFAASALTCLGSVDALCQPCASDANCPTPGDTCLILDGAGACGRDCSEGNLHGLPAGECPDGFDCQLQAGGAEQCVPKSSACDCLPDDAGATRTCAAANPDGTCFGTQACDPEVGWSECSATVPTKETCDGLDNDCNGLVDEELIHDPPTCSETNEHGTCEGTYTCNGADGWSCTAAVPAQEQCDFADNDCDGATDEEWTIGGQYVSLEHCGTCGISCVGAIPNATATCTLTGGKPSCVVETCDPGFYQASPLACLTATDALCLACVSDANCPTPGDLCLALDGAGSCGRDCSEGNLHGLPAGACPEGFACEPQPGGAEQCVPTSGSCSCLPEDAGDVRSCSVTNDDGVCFGLETCEPETGWSGCTATPAGSELCDGKDNDCDGFVDEGMTHDPPSCEESNAFGTCTAPWVCTGPDGWQCTSPVPATETCDFVDNDCDDAADEDFKVDGLYVHFDHCGTCGAGCAGAIPNANTVCVPNDGKPRCEVESCEAGYYAASPLACLAAVDALCQPCATDANCPTPGDSCLALDGAGSCGRDCGADNAHGLPPGACPDGFSCEAQPGGGEQCVPSTGSCTCLPGNGGDTRPCAAENDDGTCFGTETCDPSIGWTGCTATPAGEELCDGLDNNCNAVADEGVVHDPELCDKTNEHGTCESPWVCAGGDGWVCPAAAPAPETCDFLDNDCDDASDEDFKIDGLYVHFDHCGTCGVSCGESIPNATAKCAPNGGTPRCEVHTCAAGYYQVSPLACLPVVEALCAPCASDASCPTPGDACVPLDGSAFCGRDCSADNLHGLPAGLCPTGYTCTVVDGVGEQCLPVSASCSCLPTDAGETRPCLKSGDLGTCFGEETCDPDAGWTGCTATTPVAEVCNAADDDCNGAVDDVPGRGAACKNENPQGSCGGIMDCVPGDDALVCAGPVPKAEVCNTLDDNCDGVADEGFTVDGEYSLTDHCGECGKSCAGLFTNGVGLCGEVDGAPGCVLESCNQGFVALGGTQCVPAQLGSCDPCVTDASCVISGAACVGLEDGSFCTNPCSTTADCNDGFECTAQGPGSYCFPVTGACTCDGSNTSLQKGCTQSYAPPGGGPGYDCFGLQQCTATGWSNCEMPAEECNGLDDDCDGEIDEDFISATGGFTSDEHCGGCGNDCTLLIFPGGAGACNSTVDPPICSVSCTGGCFDTNVNPSDGCECCDPEPTDFPDSAGTDANCDAIDGEKSNAVFVSKEGDDASSGVYGAPKKTIQAGIDAAAALKLRDVYVATGVYEESITLAAGVAVYGGYSSDFLQRHLALYETAMLPPPPNDTHPGAVNAIGISGGAAGSTVFDGFSLFAADVVGDGSSMGIYLRDCDASVRISNNRVHGGRGADGARGKDGLSGADGGVGGNGVDALDLLFSLGVDNHDCAAANHSPGGTAGAGQCGTVDTEGGGGGERVCPIYSEGTKETAPPIASEKGSPGANAGGAGGAAGWDVFHLAFKCLGFATFGPLEGENGANGSNGGNGVAGGGCPDGAGSVVAGLWVAAKATDGSAGTHGSGGGGGGSGAGAWVHQSCNAKGFGRDNLGGTGGGGGGGACGATEGTAGTSGGGAFSIFVAFSAAPATVPSVHDNTIWGGIGGKGGDGGNAGTGGAGGAGGFGGAEGGNFEPPTPTYPAYEGGKGGKGGNGGHGGGGGAGCGGPAIGIFADGVDPALVAAWKTNNAFEKAGTPGAAGLGGFSLGAPGESGETGAALDTNF